jgi:hypothetical protein
VSDDALVVRTLLRLIKAEKAEKQLCVVTVVRTIRTTSASFQGTERQSQALEDYETGHCHHAMFFPVTRISLGAYWIKSKITLIRQRFKGLRGCEDP